MLGGVRGAGQVVVGQAASTSTWSGTVHQTAVVRSDALGQVERLLAEHLAARAGGA